MPTYVITVPKRYGQTDGQTIYDSNTALCTKVHRAVIKSCKRKNKVRWRNITGDVLAGGCSHSWWRSWCHLLLRCCWCHCCCRWYCCWCWCCCCFCCCCYFRCSTAAARIWVSKTTHSIIGSEFQRLIMTTLTMQWPQIHAYGSDM